MLSEDLNSYSYLSQTGSYIWKAYEMQNLLLRNVLFEEFEDER